MPLDERGWEQLDPTPISKPLRFKRQGSTLDEIRRALKIVHEEAEAAGYETLEESEDFNVGDDFDPAHDVPTRYEHEGDEAVEEAWREIRLERWRRQQQRPVADGTSQDTQSGDTRRDNPDGGGKAKPASPPGQGEGQAPKAD